MAPKRGKFANIRIAKNEMVQAIKDNRGLWAGRLTLERQGRVKLASAIARHHGGFTRFKNRFFPDTTVNRYVPPKSPLSDWERLKQALIEFRRAHKVIPTSRNLKKHGQSALREAIERHQGGYEAVWKRIGWLEEVRKVNPLAEFDAVRAEIDEMAKILGSFPTFMQIRAVAPKVAQAIDFYHGGMNGVREKYKLRRLPSATSRLRSFEAFAKEMLAVKAKLGRWPTYTDLYNLDRSDLLRALRVFYRGKGRIMRELNEFEEKKIEEQRRKVMIKIAKIRKIRRDMNISPIEGEKILNLWRRFRTPPSRILEALKLASSIPRAEIKALLIAHGATAEEIRAAESEYGF